MYKSRVSGEAIGLTARNTIKHSNKKVTSQLLEITCIYFKLVRVESIAIGVMKKKRFITPNGKGGSGRRRQANVTGVLNFSFIEYSSKKEKS